MNHDELIKDLAAAMYAGQHPGDTHGLYDPPSSKFLRDTYERMAATALGFLTRRHLLV